MKLQRRASARDEKLQRRAAARDLEHGELKGVSLDSGTAFGFIGRGMGTSLDAGTTYETEPVEHGELKSMSLDSGTAFGFTGRGIVTSLDAGTSHKTEPVEEAQDDSEEGAFKSIQRLEQRLDKSVSIVI